MYIDNSKKAIKKNYKYQFKEVLKNLMNYSFYQKIQTFQLKLLNLTIL